MEYFSLESLKTFSSSHILQGKLFEDHRQSELSLSEDIGSKSAPYLRDATFTRSKPGMGNNTPGRRNFRLQIEGELAFKEEKSNLICGPTGSGKMNLMALLGEYILITD